MRAPQTILELLACISMFGGAGIFLCIVIPYYWDKLNTWLAKNFGDTEED